MAEPFKNLAWDDFRLVNAIADARSLPGAAQLLGINRNTLRKKITDLRIELKRESS